MSRALANSDPAEGGTSTLQAMLEDLIERAHVLLDYVTGDADPDAEDGGEDEPSLGWTLSGAIGTADDLELVDEDGGTHSTSRRERPLFRRLGAVRLARKPTGFCRPLARKRAACFLCGQDQVHAMPDRNFRIILA